jgi:hypothetical protein
MVFMGEFSPFSRRQGRHFFLGLAIIVPPVIANLGLVVRPVVGVLFLLAGIFLLRNSAARAGGILITIGAILFLGAEVYGLFVLRPFVGRTYDEAWHEQIAAVDALATLGLLVTGLGLFAHAFKSGLSR